MFEISPLQKDDIPSLLALLREFAIFEKLEHTFTVDNENIERVVFEEQSVLCLIAKVEDVSVGFAIFYPVFKSFRGTKSYYLEDLYVTPSSRSKGIGYALFRAVASKAKIAGCSRLDWQVLDWNAEAINFYNRIGGISDKGNIDFRLDGPAFEKLAG